MSPEFSVVIPTRGESPWLRDAIASAVQGSHDVEVLVVHDRGTGHPAPDTEIATARVRVLDSDQTGPGGARNTGIDQARGRFVAFLDDDDVWLPDHLPWARETLSRHPEALLVAGGAYVWEDSSPHATASPPSEPRKLPRFNASVGAGAIPLRTLLLRNPILTPTVVMVRERLRDADRFRPDMPCMEDYDLWLRLTRRGLLVHDPRPSVMVRHRVRSAGRDRRGMAEQGLRALQEFLDDGVPPGTVTTRELRRRLGGLWHDLAYACLVNDDPAAARSALRQAMVRRPLQWKNYAYLVAGFSPAPIRRRLLARGRRTARESVGRRLP